MAALPFVDAHCHLWDLAGTVRYPWLAAPFAEDGPNGSVEPIARTYLLDDYRADTREWNLAGAVHVDAGAHPDDGLAETRWLQGLADEGTLPLAIVAFAALNDPDVETLLEAQAAHRSVRGIRHIVNWHPDPRRTYSAADVTLDPAWEQGFAALARHPLSFDLQCYPGQMAHIAEIAARHPRVPVIINHMGMPVLNHMGMPVLTDADGLVEWRSGMEALSALDHVAVKISGFGFIHRNWSVETIRPLVLEAIGLFGTNRTLFASDFPTDLLFAPPERCLAALATIAASFSEDEQRALWGRNAARLYRLDLAI